MKVALENDCVDVLAHALVTSLKISKQHGVVNRMEIPNKDFLVSIQERMFACVQLNTDTTGKRVEDSHNAVAAEHGHLRGAVHSAKAECVREQRMRVPQLILKQTDAHLHLLGAVPQVQIKQYFFSPKQNSSRSKEHQMLGEDWAMLPQMHLRLQAATRKLGGILNQLETV